MRDDSILVEAASAIAKHKTKHGWKGGGALYNLEDHPSDYELLRRSIDWEPTDRQLHFFQWRMRLELDGADREARRKLSESERKKLFRVCLSRFQDAYVPSVKAAAKLCEKYAAKMGSSAWYAGFGDPSLRGYTPPGAVFDGNRKLVALVSYNGRIWGPDGKTPWKATQAAPRQRRAAIRLH